MPSVVLNTNMKESIYLYWVQFSKSVAEYFSLRVTLGFSSWLWPKLLQRCNMGVLGGNCPGWKILRGAWGASLSPNILPLLDPFCTTLPAVVLQWPRVESVGGSVAGGQAGSALAAGWGRVRGGMEAVRGSLDRAIVQRPPLLASRNGKREVTSQCSSAPPFPCHTLPRHFLLDAGGFLCPLHPAWG